MTTMFLMAGACLAQAPAAVTPGPAGEVQAAYNRVKPNVMKAADKMPEAQFHTCSALTGATFDPKSVPSDTADKATVIAGLTASFVLCDKAYGSLTDQTITEILTVGPVKRSRIGLAWGNVSHDNEQYAELATYLRLKGLVPPSAEK
jgi:hypothetical protein